MRQITFTVAVGTQDGEVIAERGGALEFNTLADLTRLSNIMGGAVAAAVLSLSQELRVGGQPGAGTEVRDLDVLDDVADVLRAMGYEGDQGDQGDQE